MDGALLSADPWRCMVLACIVGCGVAADIRGIPAGVVTGCLQRTLFAAPAWMRGAILPCAPQATLQPNHTLPLFLAGVSESDTPYIPGKSSWGKNLARRGACGLASLRPNFFCRGGGRGARKRRAHAPAPPVRPSVLPITAASGHAKHFASAAFLPTSFGYGRNDKGFAGCYGP